MTYTALSLAFAGGPFTWGGGPSVPINIAGIEPIEGDGFIYWVVPAGTSATVVVSRDVTIDFDLIGQGGASGTNGNFRRYGGGGAGEAVLRRGHLLSAGSHAVTVAPVMQKVPLIAGTNSIPTSYVFTNSTAFGFTALPGGPGADGSSTAGEDGGSGGGGAAVGATVGPGGISTASDGVGFDGGTAAQNTAAAGGGATGAGVDGYLDGGAGDINGGAPIASTITGAEVRYCEGGQGFGNTSGLYPTPFGLGGSSVYFGGVGYDLCDASGIGSGGGGGRRGNPDTNPITPEATNQQWGGSGGPGAFILRYNTA